MFHVARQGGTDVNKQTTVASYAGVMDVLSSLSGQVLAARCEDDFLRVIADELREFARADAVIVQLLECRAHTRVVALADGVTVFAPDELSDPFTEENERSWLQVGGMFCRDVGLCPHMTPGLRAHVLELGMHVAYVAPMDHEGELLGHIVFAWEDVVELGAAQIDTLHKLASFVGLQFTLFNVRQGTELDPVTGLLNWYGLQRRWERVDAQRGAVLFVDVDSFRAVVERQGRLAGEDVLRQMARLVRELAGAGAIIGRFSDDSFVALLPDTCPAGVTQLAKDIFSHVEQLGADRIDPRPHVAVGAAFWPRQGRDLQALVALAEANAYGQKRVRTRLTMTTNRDPMQGRMPRALYDGWMATTGDGIIITDTDLKVTYVNPAFERMTGYTLQQWIGKTPGFIATGKTPVQVYEEMWQSINTSGTWSGHVVNRHRSGDEWMSYLTITRIADRSGRPVGFVGIARNVTDLLENAPMKVPSLAAFEDAFTKETLVYALSRAAQVHGGEAEQHPVRVRELTHLLAVAAAAQGIEPFQSYEFRSAVALASMLHDVGNLTLPRAVLQKRGKLMPQEYALIKSHTVAGRDLLRSSLLRGSPSQPPARFLEVAADIAMSHHEKWDGSGYPQGLAGEDIPVAARVVAIADVYDVLRSGRPHRKAWSHADAVAYIESQAGKHFDPKFVELFSTLSKAFKEIYERVRDEQRTSIA